ncbi:MAG: hypothetical protein MMC23_002991 [Stictis urceolatum]|nr:hypothetical protein [Stictis urceolata]
MSARDLVNLDTLILDLPIIHSNLALVLSQARSWGADRPFLEHLTAVQLDYNDEEYGSNLSHLEPLLSLPSLKTFRGHTFNIDEWTYKGTLEGCHDWNIRDIELVCSCLNDDMIKDLMKACKELRSFSLTVGDALVGAWNRASCHKIGKAFEAQKESLQTLVLDVGICLKTDALEDREGHISLKSMAKLQRIDLPQPALIDAASSGDDQQFVSLSPEPLKMLVVRECTDSILPQV